MPKITKHSYFLLLIIIILISGSACGPDKDHIIVVSAGTGGSIAPSGTVTVNDGDDQTFIITPDTGYIVLDVKVDGLSVGAITTFTFTDIVKDHTIEAAFGTQPVDVAGTWTWNETQTSIISGTCKSIGEVETYSVTITQNGNQLSFQFNDFENIATMSITGNITGNTISAAGITTFINDSTSLQITTDLTASADGKSLSGTVSQTSASSIHCTGVYNVSATKL